MINLVHDIFKIPDTFVKVFSFIPKMTLLPVDTIKVISQNIWNDYFFTKPFPILNLQLLNINVSYRYGPSLQMSFDHR